MYENIRVHPPNLGITVPDVSGHCCYSVLCVLYVVFNHLDREVRAGCFASIHWVRFVGFAGRKPVVVYNWWVTRLIR